MKNTTRTKSNQKFIIIATLLFVSLLAIALFTLNPTSIALASETEKIVTNDRYVPTLEDNFMDDKVIVTLKANKSKVNREVRIEDFGINTEKVRAKKITDLFRVNDQEKVKKIKDGDFFQILSIELETTGKEKVLEAIAELEKSDIVLAAEPDYNYTIASCWEPDDTYFSADSQWALTGTNGIQSSLAWDVIKGKKVVNGGVAGDVKVGIMEAGFDTNHEDLAGNVISGFTPPAGTNLEHGTHVAGIVGAVANNNNGVAGVAQIYLVAIDWSNLITGLQFAQNNNIWIINASFGIYQTDTSGNIIGHAPYDTSHAQAIYNYGLLGGILVCAAGNEFDDPNDSCQYAVPQNLDTKPLYPAAYSNYIIPEDPDNPARPITNVISVGSIDEGGGSSSFSNYGANRVQIFAPGNNILSTFPATVCANERIFSDARLCEFSAEFRDFLEALIPNEIPSWDILIQNFEAIFGKDPSEFRVSTHVSDGYHRMDGTSMAAPQVTGVVALLRSADSTLSPIEIKEAIMNNADTSTALNGFCVSGGRLNAFKAVSSLIYNITNIGTSNIRIDSLKSSYKTSITGALSIPYMINGRTVTEIGSSAFSGAALSAITIPSGVTNIALNAFDGCNNLGAINVLQVNNNYSSLEGVLYNADRTTLLKYPYAKTDTSFSIPASVKTIGDSAFANCTNLQSVSLVTGGNLTNTPDHTASYTNFYYSEICLNVNLIAGSTYTFSFDYDNLSATTDLTNVFTSLGVGQSSFAADLPVHTYYSSSSSGHRVITFTPTAAQLATSSKLWCRFVRTSTVQSASAQISNVTLERGVTDIKINAFTGCINLKTAGLLYTLLGNNTYAVSKGTASNGVLFIPSTHNNKAVTQIDAAGFKQTNFKWVFMQAGLTTIGNRAFQFCSNLLGVDMSQTSVTRIEAYTFDICAVQSDPNHVHNPLSPYEDTCALKDISFPPNLEYIGEGAFIRTGTPKALPDSVETIGNYAFAYAPHRLGFNFPDSLISVGAYAFAYNESFIAVYNGSLWTTIGERAFFNTLTSFGIIPASITSIGAYAFCNSSFVNFALAAESELTSIGNYAFENCGNLTTIVLPTSITTIGTGAFNNNASLTIYTERSYTPTNPSWNGSNRPIVWNCTLSTDKTYVKSFTKVTGNPSNLGAPNGMTDPYRKGYNFGGWYTDPNFSGTPVSNLGAVADNTVLYAEWPKASCIAEGTLITLADGSQVAVEDLTGEELLRVWNHQTGAFDAAPILFIDNDSLTEYEIIHLFFSDGTEVKAIYEHGFWNATLNKYVFIRSGESSQYIGDWFNKQTYDSNGNMIWTNVQLIDVQIYTEQTTAWSPVTFSHLNYYVNGMLSMPGATEGLINIFEVDETTLQYDQAAFLADIQTYGVYTYEEFAEILPIPEVIFDAFNGQYLKVSIGKGLLDMDRLVALIESYSEFFPDEDTEESDGHNGHNNGHHNGQGNGHHNGHGNGHHNGNHNDHGGRGRHGR